MDNIQFNTYTTYADITHLTDMEEKPQISPIHTDIVTGAGHAAPRAYTDFEKPLVVCYCWLSFDVLVLTF